MEEICRSDFASLSANGSCTKRFTDGDQWWAQPAEPGMAPNERVLSLARHHWAALTSTFVIWFGAVIVALATGLSFNSATGQTELSYGGAAIILSATVFLGWKIWRWKTARFVLTDQRLLFVEGIVSRRINVLPLRSVLDTTYRQSIVGRLLGYGDITLNLSGQPGLRTLTSLSRPDALYSSILLLTAVRDVTETNWPGTLDSSRRRGYLRGSERNDFGAGPAHRQVPEGCARAPRA